MYNLKHSSTISEDKAMNEIFNACRANPLRNNVGNVTFKLIAFNSATYKATLYNYPGAEVIASAIVDQWDV